MRQRERERADKALISSLKKQVSEMRDALTAHVYERMSMSCMHVRSDYACFPAPPSKHTTSTSENVYSCMCECLCFSDNHGTI